VRVEYLKAGGNGQIKLSWRQKQPAGPPRAAIDGPVQAQVGQPVNFSARNSSAAEGSNLVGYDWNFGGDASAGGVDVTHIYDSPGRYTVRLTVTDDQNLSDTAMLKIQVDKEPGEPPVAVIDAPVEAEVGQIITLDAGRSQATNPIISYAWDLGDGSNANAVTINHTYNSPGVYNVILTVTDDQGAAGRNNHQITVLELVMPTVAPELPTPTAEPEEPTPTPEETSEPDEAELPTASITASAFGQIIIPVDRTIIVPVSQTITFDGSNSQPGSSNIINYAWTFDGISSPTGGPVVTQTYNIAGRYQVALTVTDENNLSDTLTWQVQATP
jgi:PKD repeat protein